MSQNLLHKIYSIFSPAKFDDPDIVIIEKIISYRFKDKKLLVKALTHSSFLSVTREEVYQSNERLEFLGDAVLDLVVTEFLYSSLPMTQEGDLSKMKSILVSRNVLAEIVAGMDLGKYLFLNKGEEKTGGRKRISNLANLYEALLGAIYLDGGLKPAQHFILQTLLDDHEDVLQNKSFINYKSILLEYAQGKGADGPNYSLIDETGPDHEKKFVIQVSLDGIDTAQGEGKNKKTAEQSAARGLLRKIAPELVNQKQ